MGGDDTNRSLVFRTKDAWKVEPVTLLHASPPDVRYHIDARGLKNGVYDERFHAIYGRNYGANNFIQQYLYGNGFHVWYLLPNNLSSAERLLLEGIRSYSNEARNNGHENSLLKSIWNGNIFYSPADKLCSILRRISDSPERKARIEKIIRDNVVSPSTLGAFRRIISIFSPLVGLGTFCYLLHYKTILVNFLSLYGLALGPFSSFACCFLGALTLYTLLDDGYRFSRGGCTEEGWSTTLFHIPKEKK